MKNKIITLLKIALFLWFFSGINDLICYFFYFPYKLRVLDGFILSTVFLLPAMFIRKGLKIYLVLIYSLSLLPSVIYFFHLLLFKKPLLGEVWYTVFESPLSEILEFTTNRLNMAIIALVFICCSIPLFFLKTISPLTFSLKEKTIIGLVVFLGILFSLNKSDWNFKLIRNDNYHIDFFMSYWDYKKEKNALLHSSEERKPPVEVTNLLPKEIQPTYVIIIGEATGRYHMGLYGYKRNTTPQLEKIKDELYLFDSVISSATYSIPSLKNILTFSTRKDKESFLNKESIIEIFNLSGYNTYWISNQKPLGFHSTAISIMAKKAKVSSFTSDKHFNVYEYLYDDILLPEIDKVLNSDKGKKVLFIHLMGTHENYEDRYPDEYNIFHDSSGINPLIKNLDKEKIDIINSYDNAVVYTDFMVRSIIEQVRRQNEFSYVLFFPDHGEDVYDESEIYGHAENTSRYVYEIPFFLWTSPKYDQHFGEREDGMKAYISRPYCTEDVIHGILDISGLHTKYLDKTRSVFSPHYLERDEYKNW